MKRPIRRLGLRGRLVATTVLAALAAAVVLVVGLQVLLAKQNNHDALVEVGTHADAAAATITFTHFGVRVVDVEARSIDQGVWIFDEQHRRLDDGHPPPPAIAAVVEQMSHAHTRRSRIAGGDFRLLAEPVIDPVDPARHAVVVAAVSLHQYDLAEQRALTVSLTLAFLAVAGAGVAAWFASGSALGKVREMAQSADAWREHDLSGRFDLGPPTDELSQLAQTLDRMLDRIAQVIRAERRLTDEVAHELRTPLSVIHTEAQLGLMTQGKASTRESLESILAASTRMRGSIDTMLAVARSANLDGEHCRIEEVLSHVREQSAPPEGIELEVRPCAQVLELGAPVRVVTAAIAPVVANAIRFAAARVTVHAEVDGRICLIHVEDDGPGVPTGEQAAIFVPGHSSSASSGLGLPLARRLAHSVGGEVELVDGEHGHFVVSVPLL